MKPKGSILIIVALIAAGIAFLYLSDKPKQIREAVVGLEVLEFSLFTEKGEPLSLSQLRGKTLFIHFWASWCKECREEMPGIQALHERKKSDPSFMFLSVIYREDPVKSRQWLTDNNYDFPIYTDPGENAAAVFGVTAVPETFMIGPDGKVTLKIIGPGDWDSI